MRGFGCAVFSVLRPFIYIYLIQPPHGLPPLLPSRWATTDWPRCWKIPNVTISTKGFFFSRKACASGAATRNSWWRVLHASISRPSVGLCEAEGLLERNWFSLFSHPKRSFSLSFSNVDDRELGYTTHLVHVDARFCVPLGISGMRIVTWSAPGNGL